MHENVFWNQEMKIKCLRNELNEKWIAVGFKTSYLVHCYDVAKKDKLKIKVTVMILWGSLFCWEQNKMLHR